MNLTVNETLHGFRVTQIREIGDCHGTLYEMVHEKTGALLAWLKREDENKTFCIGFRTTPEDDSGVFHICEHSVLNGSEKYPLKEPFVYLLKSSMQTFLNAMTYPDKTIYPVSSRNPQDFLNLMDVYLDAVLHPLIHTNPNIFYQEGWHYEIRSPEADPVYKGVVFNEMKGAFSSVDEVLTNELSRVLFPDSCYRFVSGGDPEKITDLSYEQFVKAHATYYHPSNSMTFLDGDLDIDAALAKINGFFEVFEKEGLEFPIHVQQPVASSSREVPYEIGADEDPKEKTVTAIAKVIGTYRDVEKLTAWRALFTALAGSNEAPLKKAILSKNLGQDVEAVVMDDIMQPYILVAVRNTEKENVPEIQKVLKETVQGLVETGLRKEELRAILNNMEFNYRERKEPAGLMFATASYQSWLYGGDPAMYFSCGEVFETLRQKAEHGYFEELLKEGLLGEDLCTVTAVPDPKLSAARAAKEKEKLAAAKASWGDEIYDLIEKNRILDEYQATEDTQEQKDTLPKLKKSDLKLDPTEYEMEEKEIRGVPVLLYPESATGIVYFNLYFNLAGVTRDHMPEVSLLTDLLTRLRTKSHTLLQLQEEVRANIGTLRFTTDAFTVRRERETCLPVLSVSCSVLKQNAEKAAELILEILKETLFEKETILPLLQQSRESYRQMFIADGHAAAVRRAGAHNSAEHSVKEAFSGYDAACYITKMTESYEEYADEIINNCGMYCEQLFIASRLTVSVSGESNLPMITKLIQSLPFGDAHRAVIHVPLLKEKKEGIQVPAQVSYAVAANNLQDFDCEYNGAIRVMAQILTYGYLWNEIRVKGGAYGTGFAASPSGNIAAWSYRDPTPENSLQMYRKAADYIEALAKENEDLTSYIIGTISAGEPLESPMRRIRGCDAKWFSGITYEIRKRVRHEILNTTNADLLELCQAVRNALDSASVCVIGPEDALKRCGIETIYSI